MSFIIRASNEDLDKACKQASLQLLPKIHDLIDRIDVFSWGLLNYYTDVYLTTDTSRSLELMNYKNRKYRVTVDLNELQNELDTFRKQYGQHNLQMNNASKKLDAVVNDFDKSCTLVEGIHVVQAATRDLKSLNYVAAITKLHDLHKKLDAMVYTGDVATAVNRFRTISENQLVTVQGQLNVEWSKLFKWNFNRTIDTLTFSLTVQQKDPILLKTVVTALYKTNQIMVEMRGFSQFFTLDVLPNILKYNCEISIEDRVGALVLSIRIDLPGTGQPSIQTIFNNLTAVFEFLQCTVGEKVQPEYTFIKTFGDCNRHEFFSKIIHDCIKSNLPSCENSARAYRDIVLELEMFNKFLVDLKYIKAEESPVKKYIDNVDLLLYDTKCNKLLNEVREILKESITQRPVTVGLPEADDYYLDDLHKAFKSNGNQTLLFPQCRVSENVKKVGAMIVKHLEDCTQFPPEFGNQLAYYIKDIAVFYECAVADRNVTRLKRNALEVGLYLNNCNYLAHTMIGPPWKNILHRELANSLNTIVMPHVFDLRTNGSEKLALFIQRKKEMLSTRIGPSSKLIDDWNEYQFEIFSKDVNMCIRFLEELRDTWKHVLSAGTFEDSMCALIGAMCEAMTSYVFQRIGGTTENVVKMLLSCFQSCANDLTEMFPYPINMEAAVKQWSKFIGVQKLLKASLTDIGAMWSRRDTHVRCFPCEYVRGIIKIRFPYNNNRLKILKEIQ